MKSKLQELLVAGFKTLVKHWHAAERKNFILIKIFYFVKIIVRLIKRKENGGQNK